MKKTYDLANFPSFSFPCRDNFLLFSSRSKDALRFLILAKKKKTIIALLDNCNNFSNYCFDNSIVDLKWHCMNFKRCKRFL